jgi:hypothetical protein
MALMVPNVPGFTCQPRDPIAFEETFSIAASAFCSLRTTQRYEEVELGARWRDPSTIPTDDPTIAKSTVGNLTRLTPALAVIDLDSRQLMRRPSSRSESAHFRATRRASTRACWGVN